VGGVVWTVASTAHGELAAEHSARVRGDAAAREQREACASREGQRTGRFSVTTASQTGETLVSCACGR
jgi:hypothetical protein